MKSEYARRLETAVKAFGRAEGKARSARYALGEVLEGMPKGATYKSLLEALPPKAREALPVEDRHAESLLSECKAVWVEYLSKVTGEERARRIEVMARYSWRALLDWRPSKVAMTADEVLSEHRGVRTGTAAKGTGRNAKGGGQPLDPTKQRRITVSQRTVDLLEARKGEGQVLEDVIIALLEAAGRKVPHSRKSQGLTAQA